MGLVDKSCVNEKYDGLPHDVTSKTRVDISMDKKSRVRWAEALKKTGQNQAW